MSETKKCPKCNGEMKKEGEDVRINHKWVGYLVLSAYICINCGYVEFFQGK